MVRGWRLGSAKDEKEREELRYRSRSLSIVPGLDGMYHVRGLLTPEQANMVMRAIDAAADVLFREAWPGAAYESRMPAAAQAVIEASRPEETRAAAARRRADALELLAERALWAGFGGERPGDAEPGEAEPGAAGSAPVPISGSRAARTQVVLHVDLDLLRGGSGGTAGTGGDRSEFADGTRVTAETARRLCCDASVVPLFLAPDAGTGAGSDAGSDTGSDTRFAPCAGRRIIDVGHMKRIVSPALRRALDARDGGCRFPGCGHGFAEAHHVIHWGAGGRTSLENCLLLCRHHHRLVHEGEWRVVYMGIGNPTFLDPLGGSHYSGRFRAPTLAPGRPGAAEFAIEHEDGSPSPPDEWGRDGQEGRSEAA